MQKFNYILDLDNDLLIYLESYYPFQINDQIELEPLIEFEYIENVYKLYGTTLFSVERRWISFDENEIEKLNKDFKHDGSLGVKVNIGEITYINLKMNPCI